MNTIIDRRLFLTSSLLGMFLLLLTFTAQAAFIFTGESIGVSFDGTIAGAPDPISITGAQNIVANNTTQDIVYGDGSSIGNGVMLDGEFIDFTDDSVTFQLRGDGSSHTTTGYQTTGLLTGIYQISLDAVAFSIGNITGIDITTIGMDPTITGVSLGSEITYDAKNIYFDISTLGILEVTPGADLGSITLNVEFVPIPAALPLMLSGLAGLVFISRRKAHKTNT